MPLQTSGELSVNDLRGEFGYFGNPRSWVQQYYAGGGLVPSGCEGINGPIPTFVPAEGWPLSLYYGACLAAPLPSATFNFVAAEGDPDPTVYAAPATPQGWQTLCQETGSPGFGGPISGSNLISPGYANEGFEQVVLWYENVPIYNKGVMISMINASYLSTQYQLTIQIIRQSDGTNAYYKTFQTSQADSDGVVSVNYGGSCGSTKNVRQIYWYDGIGGPGGPDFTGSAYRWYIFISRTSG